MSAAYLEKLNPDQRRAVEHGICEHGVGEPATEAAPALLVIAGAGSGKTSTLAHRVVHLAANGVDPRRILLMTFSRRAAVEMTRRVQRIGNEAFGANRSAGGALAGALTGTLSWAGTFHAIGARLLREYAPQIGLEPAFTIHDREDSADLMNLVRHDLGFSTKESRFPTKATCLAIYSRAVNAEQELDGGAGESLPVVLPLGRRAAGAVRRLSRRQAAPARARLRRPPALLGADDVRAVDRGRRRRPVRSRAGRRVSGHQPAPGLDPAQAQAGRARADRGRRRRAIDLFVPGRHGAQHPRIPRAVPRAGGGGDAGAQLPVERTDPGGVQCGDLARGGTLHQEPVVGARVERTSAARHRRRRDRPGALRRRARSGKPRGRHAH